MLAHNAETKSDGVFLVDERGSLSWAGAWNRARSVAAGFAALGVAKGDTVAVMLDNCREFVDTWFGLGSAGAVEVPVHPLHRGERLKHVLNHSGARIAVVDAR